MAGLRTPTEVLYLAKEIDAWFSQWATCPYRAKHRMQDYRVRCFGENISKQHINRNYWKWNGEKATVNCGTTFK